MRQTLNEIVAEELQAEYDEIIEYRKAVASGIDDTDHPVLDDTELTNALEKVITHFKTKINGYSPIDYGQFDLNFAVGNIDALDTSIGDIDYNNELHYGYSANHITVTGTDHDTK